MKTRNILLSPIKVIYALFISLLKSIFIDLPKNIKLALIFSFYPEKRKEISRKIEMEKHVKNLEERLSLIERLVYSVFEDNSYIKSKKGKMDISDLRKKIK